MSHQTTAIALPVRGQTLEQRRANLRHATEIRSARATMKRDLKAGERTISDLIDRPDVQTMQVAKLLRAQPHWGKVRTRKALLAAGITNPLVTVGRLTDRQRAALIAVACTCQPPTARRVIATAA